jgi:DsbC/DsbD-like thiol-disulfide interchange protein
MKRQLYALCLALAGAFTAPVHANPAADLVEASILTGWRAADGRHVAALHLELQEGWKTYWRAPGDAGIPPRFDWSGSRNLSDVAITWPTPRILSQSGVRTIGYAETLTLPMHFTPKQKGQAITLDGTLELGLCKDVCLPLTLRISQALPTAEGTRDPRIVAALAARPYSAREAGVGRVVCSVSPVEGGMHLRAEIDVKSYGRGEVAVIETDNPQIWVARAKTNRQGGRLVAETDLYHVEGKSFALNRDGLRITVMGGGKAVDIQGCPAR